MDTATQVQLHDQLLDRRRRLTDTIGDVGEAGDLVRLLGEVDAALERMKAGSYGWCEVCHEHVDDKELLANPLIQYCLCSLTPEQQRALQNDLDMAGRIQWALLPKQDLSFAGWEVHHRYEPAGPVSGDYCDVIAQNAGRDNLYVLAGDVSGKGVAASLLMAHLNALFRSLVETDLPVTEMVARANRLFGESTITSHYVTLVCAKADGDGGIEVCNAGHPPPMLVQNGDVATVGSTGPPVGLIDKSPYDRSLVTLEGGDTLFLYTDGLTEAGNGRGEEYGRDRLARVLRGGRGLSPRALSLAVLRDLAAFQDGEPRVDDLTIVVVRRAA
jgi:sigma-B regulation protein RsbU (phosphoserine phosphatase)